MMQPQDEKPLADSANIANEPPAVVQGEQRPVDPKAPDDVLTRRIADAEDQDRKVLAESGRYTRRAFVIASLASVAGYAGYRELAGASGESMQPAP